jgi:hypothetical protein
MSAHATVTVIEQEAAALCRRRFRDQAEYLAAKDSHCKRIAALMRQLRPQRGTVEKRSSGTFGGSETSKAFTVAGGIGAAGNSPVR